MAAGWYVSGPADGSAWDLAEIDGVLDRAVSAAEKFGGLLGSHQQKAFTEQFVH